ncbi:MAG: hypothetical protein ACXAB4_03380 [Candidatus Hodarchaeales archaeon]|jgi:hypothetical protein
MGINFVALVLFLFFIATGVLGIVFGRLRPLKDPANKRHQAWWESEARKRQPGCYF